MSCINHSWASSEGLAGMTLGRWYRPQAYCLLLLLLLFLLLLGKLRWHLLLHSEPLASSPLLHSLAGQLVIQPLHSIKQVVSACLCRCPQFILKNVVQFCLVEVNIDIGNRPQGPAAIST
jgi:hypothetical protein